MEATPEDTAATRPQTPHYTEDAPVPPSLWRSVLHAFRQARLMRLEARIERLRRHTLFSPAVRDQRVVLVAAERLQTPPEAGWLSVPTRPRQRLSSTVVVCILTLAGITFSVFYLRSREGTAAALLPPSAEPQAMSAAREATTMRMLVETLKDHLTALQHQVDQQHAQLNNQITTVLEVSQHADTHETQLTTLADAVTALTAQIAHIEQQVRTQDTRLAVQEKQLATQAVHLGTVREQTRGGVSPIAATGRSSGPRPPTLEVFAPPPVQAITPVPSPTLAVPAVGTHPARRSITLPASLGAVGFRGANNTTGGPQP